MGSATIQIGLFLVNAAAGFFVFMLVLRFLLQVARADYHNPISQMLVKITNPLLVPTRKVIPGFGGLDLAALVLALLVSWVAMLISMFITDAAEKLGGLTPALMLDTVIWGVVGLFGLILKVYLWGTFISVIASWVAPNSSNPALILVHQILEPVMRPIRQRMPDMGGLDISPMILILVIVCVEIVITETVSRHAPPFVLGL